MINPATSEATADYAMATPADMDRAVASARARLALPIYNVIDTALFGLPFMRRLRPFVLTVGEKR